MSDVVYDVTSISFIMRVGSRSLYLVISDVVCDFTSIYFTLRVDSDLLYLVIRALARFIIENPHGCFLSGCSYTQAQKRTALGRLKAETGVCSLQADAELTFLYFVRPVLQCRNRGMPILL
jgi:hypothetical protein